MNALVLLLVGFIAADAGLAADLPARSIAKKGELIFSDDFARTDLGDKWRVTTPTFVIVDGVLRAGQTKAEHGAVARIDIGKKDMVIEFKFRFEGASSINAVCNDRAYRDSHGSHICRVSLSPSRIFLGDDKERLSHAIEEMMKDPQRKDEVRKLVAGRSLSIPAKIEPNRWYGLRIEIAGDELRASLDDKPIGTLKSSGIGHPVKSDFHFTVSGKDALFDDVRVWNAVPELAP
jgi:hypothetical protein